MIQSDADLVRYHEGCTLTAKPDAKSMWSIGWGHDIPPPSPGAEAPTCTQGAADAWLDADIALARQRAAAAFQSVNSAARWENLDPVRQAALVDLAYQIGGDGVLGFPNMLSALYRSEWENAAWQLMHKANGDPSDIVLETPKRTRRRADMFIEGAWPTV